MESWPGEPYPLGATLGAEGVNFAVCSEHATGVELCLFEGEAGEREAERLRLTEYSDQTWHIFVPGLKAGQRYGYRVQGPFEPGQGLRFNPAKLLLDPYARAIDRSLRWQDELFGYPIGHPEGDLARDERDSAAALPRSVVVDGAYDWAGEQRPRVPWHETVIYEAHVKGLTRRHPGVPEALRGTYAGLASPAILEHLQGLGVTALELMPVHHFVADRHLVERGLTNYWGYNSIGFFAPDVRYASAGGGPGRQVREFKDMVRALHGAGIEVILDVVYNHTAEGNHLGPTLCFRGLDNTSYYRTVRDEPRYYMDYTGCGNTLNMMNPRCLQLLMDSLRYWVLEMHVDGFRFDLAASLARELHDVDRLGSFFDTINQDPVISRVKLIAEPWDVGEGGYQVGNFPPLWSEWNGKYRDCVRDYWRGEPATLAEFAFRFTGSSDLYEEQGRRPHASINFVTAHDGFTLHDLVSFNEKHNEANGEENRDGESHNRSWNCGAEGPSADPAIQALRAQQKRNFVATLLLSQGVPMLLAGDELGRTQQGNNNAYCQDNEISWLDWPAADPGLLAFTAALVRFRREHAVFRRRRWFQGRPLRGTGVTDIGWFSPDGQDMTEEHWSAGFAKSLGVFLNGEGIPSRDPRGRRITDDSFLLLFNAHHEPLPFALPDRPWGRRWRAALDTAAGWVGEGEAVREAGAQVAVAARSLLALKKVG